jgi:hypothetical protein
MKRAAAKTEDLWQNTARRKPYQEISKILTVEKKHSPLWEDKSQN